LGCIEPSAHLEGCVKLSLLGSASARAAKLAKSAEERSTVDGLYAWAWLIYVCRCVVSSKQASKQLLRIHVLHCTFA
jgi:hypothetical protein